jgi:hypothetical protein
VIWLLPQILAPLLSASWLGYGFKNLWKIYSLAYGFSFFVIPSQEVPPAPGVHAASSAPGASVPAIVGATMVLLLLKSSVQDMHKRIYNYVYSKTVLFYILVINKVCCLPAKYDLFFRY